METTIDGDAYGTTNLPTTVVCLVVGILGGDETIDLTERHLLIGRRENRLHDQLSVGEGWFGVVLRMACVEFGRVEVDS